MSNPLSYHTDRAAVRAAEAMTAQAGGIWYVVRDDTGDSPRPWHVVTFDELQTYYAGCEPIHCTA